MLLLLGTPNMIYPIMIMLNNNNNNSAQDCHLTIRTLVVRGHLLV